MKRQQGCDYESRGKDAIYGKKLVIHFCNRAYRGYNLCLGTIWISFKDVEETKQEIKL